MGAAPIGGVISVPMPPPVAVEPARRPAPRRTSRGALVAVVVLAVLVAALGGVVVARELAAPTDVTLEPVATAGANPFMASVGTDVPDVRPVAHTGGSWSGTTPGLYGGSGSTAVCDRARLSRFLGEHPDRAAGWAAVLGLRDGSASTVSSYVDGLTSVVLRSDTYVTNHGWAGGHVTSWPAVLQAGTAVLVDQHGNLVTRCACGNPLTAAQSLRTVAYVGPRWSSFTSTSITVITHRTTQVTTDLTIIDVHTGRGHDRPHGSDGEEDTENASVRAVVPESPDPAAGPTSEGPPAAVGSTGPTTSGTTTGTTTTGTTTTGTTTTTPPSSTTTTSASAPSGDYTARGAGSRPGP
ncbi:hypothetical protein PHK61_14640 [Actinomycetospora lutea]|uniref:DUF6777 domain-containing protein n=1 Tax=Actinomycetospora lutea TaxID=663604 RepID=UPI0023673E53|nr:DUF6777 domain-containing protein [Actinomycetospora lutea]MDD7939659.1 hypothetical protein [Actinomycetospora lutea]